MSWRFPGRQWKSRVKALGGAHMAPPVELDAPIIPYPGAPAAWTYPSSSLSLTVGVPMTPLVPTITGGVPYTWHAENTAGFQTTLPTGISVNPETGVISGTPTTITPLRALLITSFSKGGATRFRLTITVS